MERREEKGGERTERMHDGTRTQIRKWKWVEMGYENRGKEGKERKGIE